MSFNAAPNQWIPEISEDGTDITVPIASFPQLTAEEADGTSGDIRKLLFAICDALAAKWNALDAADRPTKMVISRATSVSDATGKIKRRYSFEFDLEAVAEEVQAE